MRIKGELTVDKMTRGQLRASVQCTINSVQLKDNIKAFSRWNRLGFDSRGFQPTGEVYISRHRCFLEGQIKKFTVDKMTRGQLKAKASLQFTIYS